MTKRPTVICHFRNEEFLLRWWIPHHKQIFGHGVLIDYGSTDGSAALCRDLAPDWDYVQSRNTSFDAAACDAEVMDIERGIPGWKMALNATEFLWPMDVRPLLRTAEARGDVLIEGRGVIMADPLAIVGMTPAVQDSLVSQRYWGFLEDEGPPSWQADQLWRSRVLHRGPDGHYDVGRHRSHLDGSHWAGSELRVLWFGFSPWTRELLERRLAVQQAIPADDRAAARGFQHLVGLEDSLAMFVSLSLRSRDLRRELGMGPAAGSIPMIRSSDDDALSFAMLNHDAAVLELERASIGVAREIDGLQSHIERLGEMIGALRQEADECASIQHREREVHTREREAHAAALHEAEGRISELLAERQAQAEILEGITSSKGYRAIERLRHIRRGGHE